MRVPDLGALGFAAVKDFPLWWLELIRFDSYDSSSTGLCYGTRGVRSGRERRGIDSDRFYAPAINSCCEALISRPCMRETRPLCGGNAAFLVCFCKALYEFVFIFVLVDYLCCLEVS